MNNKKIVVRKAAQALRAYRMEFAEIQEWARRANEKFFNDVLNAFREKLPEELREFAVYKNGGLAICIGDVEVPLAGLCWNLNARTENRGGLVVQVFESAEFKEPLLWIVPPPRVSRQPLYIEDFYLAYALVLKAKRSPKKYEQIYSEIATVLRYKEVSHD